MLSYLWLTSNLEFVIFPSSESIGMTVKSVSTPPRLFDAHYDLIKTVRSVLEDLVSTSTENRI